MVPVILTQPIIVLVDIVYHRNMTLLVGLGTYFFAAGVKVYICKEMIPKFVLVVLVIHIKFLSP